MIRYALSAGALALLAACGPVAEESDDPGATPTPPPTEGGARSDGATVAAPGQRPAAFAQCAVCHQVEPGRHGIGPSLAGVFGAVAGHVPDYAYSQAIRRSGLVWDEATLDRYLEAPLRTVPGTKMSYAGMRDADRRQAVIAYLKTL